MGVTCLGQDHCKVFVDLCRENFVFSYKPHNHLEFVSYFAMQACNEVWPKFGFQPWRYLLDCHGFLDLDLGDALLQSKYCGVFPSQGHRNFMPLRLPSQVRYPPHLTGWTTPKVGPPSACTTFQHEVERPVKRSTMRLAWRFCSTDCGWVTVLLVWLFYSH